MPQDFPMLPRKPVPGIDNYDWRRIAGMARGPANCRCSVKTLHCECTACRVVYNAAGKASPHQAGSCPYANPKKAEVNIGWVSEVVPFGEAEWDAIVAAIDRDFASPSLQWVRDPSQKPKEPKWPTISRIKSSAAGNAFSDERARFERDLCSVFGISPAELGVASSHKEDSMSISNSAMSNLVSEVRRLGRDYNADLGSISAAIRQAEAEREEITVNALRALAKLEKAKNRRAGKEFVLAYQWRGDEYVVHGFDFGHNKKISEDNDDGTCRVFFVGEHPGLDYEHHTIESLNKHLGALEITHAPIEILD